MKWVKSLRLPICILAGLLTVMSFRIAHRDPQWLMVLAVIFIACSTMLQNDWRDRCHDVKKGKTLATNNPRAFLCLVIIFWSVSFGLVGAILCESAAGLLLIGMGLVGLIYSEIRKIPMASVLVTAITSGSPALLPTTMGVKENLLPIFLSVTLVIFGREITKDVEDQGIDQNYKWTLPLHLGATLSKAISLVSISAGLIATFVIHSALLGLVVSVFGLVLIFGDNQVKKGRAWLDAGFAISILTITLRG